MITVAQYVEFLKREIEILKKVDQDLYVYKYNPTYCDYEMVSYHFLDQNPSYVVDTYNNDYNLKLEDPEILFVPYL